MAEMRNRYQVDVNRHYSLSITDPGTVCYQEGACVKYTPVVTHVNVHYIPNSSSFHYSQKH